MPRKLLFGFALCLLSTSAAVRSAFAWNEEGLVEIYSIDFEPADRNLGDELDRVHSTTECNEANGRSCESLVGNTIADAMRATYGTDLAIQNSGGLRADLTCPIVNVPTDNCPAYAAALPDHGWQGEYRPALRQSHRDARGFHRPGAEGDARERRFADALALRPIPADFRILFHLRHRPDARGAGAFRQCARRATAPARVR